MGAEEREQSNHSCPEKLLWSLHDQDENFAVPNLCPLWNPFVRMWPWRKWPLSKTQGSSGDLIEVLYLCSRAGAQISSYQ
jgi:hypothetical protein